MHRNSVYAMVAAIALTAGLVLVAGGPQTPRPTDTLAIELTPTSSTSTVITVTTISAAREASEVDEILGAVVDDHSTESTSVTTTTTLPAPTTTRPASPSPTTTKPKPTTTTTKATTTTSTTPGEFRSDFEAEFLSRINGLRASHGLAPLTRDGSLDNRARDWSKRMFDAGKLSHSNIANLLPPWSAAGENVGRGASVSSLFDALTNSPNHRANMLADFTHIGIGVWKAGNGTLWTTHVFTR